VEIHTGRLEEHIVADVAWATAHYLEWTGDQRFLSGAGARLLVETARWWASRIEQDPDGGAHIRRVIGPDEYHVGVDDNAFTNVMARWNLRRAAALGQAQAGGVGEDERRAWLAAADSLVDGYDPDTGLYEQFDGFLELEPLVIADLAPKRPIAADLLLGPERIASSQVVKQADVLMLHHLLPDQVEPGSLTPNLHFYEPRTAHASSLSPGVHAALLARAGELDDAVAWLKLTSRIDLDDLSETTAGGVHLAAMGSVWQALAFGFAGVRPAGEVLRVDPRLPSQWGRLGLRLCFRGTAVRVEIRPDGVEVVPEAPLVVQMGDEEAVAVGPQGALLETAPKRKDGGHERDPGGG
jgi:trehalose/maltose hydrolase-like predicted phosphorylase